ncbi:MAG: alpha-L-fucosidase [Agriterribacter sp.]
MKVLSTLFITLLLSGLCSNAQVSTKEQSLQKFMQDRFGMFIHWGPVALRGTEIGWSRDREVPKQDYDSLYKEFNPVLFDADRWVKTAKDAGMKYLTITARHHDGFCLWPTKFTHYNIMNTPYKVDIVGALSKACKKQGIKFCIYYSILDWWHPEYPLHSAHNKPTPDPKSDMTKYIGYLKNQLKELITNYDPYMLWFDGQWETPWTDEMGKDIYHYIHQLKPTIICNNRLGKEFAAIENKDIDASKMIGDYDTPEQVVGRLNLTTPWESCFTLGDQWAWKPNDRIKSLQTCLSILSKTAGGNGNLLLNVGPMLDGRIEHRQIHLLKEIGNWLKVNGEAIYGTQGGPYNPNDNFATTRKGNKLYVHVLNTDTTAITLSPLPETKITKAYILKGTAVKVKEDGQGITIPVVKSNIPYLVVLELNKPAVSIPVIK